MGQALDSGINLIDTAPAYGLGRALEGRRDQTVIATKVALQWPDANAAAEETAGEFEKLRTKVRPIYC